MKMKTHSGAKKRVRITGKGKIKVAKTSKKHLLINKSKRQKKFGQSSHGIVLDKTQEKRARHLIPYL
jgi:large subunit ribosomal protein L35